MLYLLDSTAVIDWLRGRPRALSLLAELVESGHTLASNAVTIAEVYSGLHADERTRAAALFTSTEYWEIDEETAALAGAYRYRFARQGITLSVPDVLTAAQAVRRGAVLVTGNVKHFPMPEIELLRLTSS